MRGESLIELGQNLQVCLPVTFQRTSSMKYSEYLSTSSTTRAGHTRSSFPTRLTSSCSKRRFYRCNLSILEINIPRPVTSVSLKPPPSSPPSSSGESIPSTSTPWTSSLAAGKMRQSYLYLQSCCRYLKILMDHPSLGKSDRLVINKFESNSSDILGKVSVITKTANTPSIN